MTISNLKNVVQGFLHAEDHGDVFVCTGVAFKEGMCYGKPEAAGLFFVTPLLLLGHLTGWMPESGQQVILNLLAVHPLLPASPLLACRLPCRVFLQASVYYLSAYMHQSRPFLRMTAMEHSWKRVVM